jgi:mono/diheme cytochrome c family protein
MNSCLGFLVLAAALGLRSPPGLAAQLTADDGKSLAQQYCSACHQVTKEQALPPNVVVDTGTGSEEFEPPSFAAIARKDRSEAALRDRILHPYYPMREQQFVPEELDAIIAYILALRAADGSALEW